MEGEREGRVKEELWGGTNITKGLSKSQIEAY